MFWSTVSKAFEDQLIYHEQIYLHQEFSLLTQLDWEVHRKLKYNIESQIIVNILTCIFQQNHKSCYTTSFQRFYQELIIVRLAYSFSILILIFFLWTGITLANLSSEGKTQVEKERLNILVVCNLLEDY